MRGIDRREFLKSLGAGAALLTLPRCAPAATATTVEPTPGAAFDRAPTATPIPANGVTHPRPSFFKSRGVVLTTSDLTLGDWPGRLAAANFTAIALHSKTPYSDLVPFVQSPTGLAFLDRCDELGIDVEYEIHAASSLIPRTLFATHSDYFRFDATCKRNPDHNFCVHTPEALDLAAENAVALCRILRSTTHRYFLWGDDNKPWCQCQCCLPLVASDQALTYENHVVAALRTVDPDATLAHLAYANTLAAPVTVTPAPGIFLEFSPLGRSYTDAITTLTDPAQPPILAALQKNLEVFGPEDAQILEYWFDDSLFSLYRKPQTKLPFDPVMVAQDAAYYRSLAIPNIRSFGVFLDADYEKLYGDPPINQFGEILATTY